MFCDINGAFVTFDCSQTNKNTRACARSGTHVRMRRAFEHPTAGRPRWRLQWWIKRQQTQVNLISVCWIRCYYQKQKTKLEHITTTWKVTKVWSHEKGDCVNNPLSTVWCTEGWSKRQELSILAWRNYSRWSRNWDHLIRFCFVLFFCCCENSERVSELAKATLISLLRYRRRNLLVVVLQTPTRPFQIVIILTSRSMAMVTLIVLLVTP